MSRFERFLGWVLERHGLPADGTSGFEAGYSDVRKEVRGRPVPDADDDYRIFTTEFDRVVSAASLGAGTEVLGGDGATQLGPMLADNAAAIDVAAERMRAAIAGKRPVPEVAILVDHSGSIARSEPPRTPMVIMAVGVIAATLTQAGIPFELLGYTTRSWKGGEAREKWLSTGAPPRPGRLCSLLHIVYDSSATAEAQLVQLARVLSNLDIGKENVDGEALLWARSRLPGRPGHRRLIVHVGDGSASDDSTNYYNGGQYLQRHLLEVGRALVAEPDLAVLAIGIGGDMPDVFVLRTRLDAATDATALPELLAAALQG